MTQEMRLVISTTLSLLRFHCPTVIPLYEQMRGNLANPDYKPKIDRPPGPPKEIKPTNAAIYPNFRSTQKAQTLMDINDKKRQRLEDLLKLKTAPGLKEICGIHEGYKELHDARNGIIA